MKKLFVLVLLVSAMASFAAPADQNRKPARGGAQPPPAAVEAAPAPPRERKPGFWERAWTSTKKGTRSAGRLVTRPFRGGGDKSNDSKLGWRNLSMALTVTPEIVKLPDTKAMKVAFSVVNGGKEAVQLEFPTTQRIEVLLKTADGRQLSKWSDDQRVEKEEGFLVINPTERLQYTVTVSTREMSAGKTYIVEAYFPDFDQLRTSKTIIPTN